MFMRLFSLCPRRGREFSSRIVENFLFNCPGVTRFAKIIKFFCRAKRYSVAPLLTNLSTPAILDGF